MKKRIKKKKRVLIIVENLPVPHDKRVWKEANSLTKAGYDVSVICPKGKGYNKKYEVVDNIHIFRHPLPIEARGAKVYLIEYSIALFWEIFLSFKVFFKRGFDVIQACNPPDLMFIIAIIFKVLFNVKFIFDHHDGNPEIWIAKGGSKNFMYKLLLFFERCTFKQASVSFSVNSPYKEIAVNRGKMHPENVYIVRNSPKLKEVDTGKYKKKTHKTIVGYLGVMGKQDGIDSLLRVMRHIVYKKKRTDMLLRLMGNGPEFNHLNYLSQKLGINDYTEFTGWISGEDYYRNIAECDLCVNADQVNEYNNHCSPNKIYEYMFFSKPIVQYKMQESKVVAMDAALYVEPDNLEDFAEKILTLADDPAKRQEMGKYGKKRLMEYFTWDKAEVEYLKGFEKVFKKINI